MTYNPKAAAAALEAAGAMLDGVTEEPWELSDTWSYYRHQLYVEHGGAEIAHAASCDDRDNDAPESPAMDEALNNARFIAYAREGVPALAAHLTAAMADNERLREAWAMIKSAIVETHGHWDGDRDSKVGKMLMSLSGRLPGYRHDIDEARALLEKPE